ncbi:helix-hairpin-helix domain-containing protein [Brevibacillus sp. NRS-1366]|uniref:helix-hairpin-helix domain-containing protein n=1 Tax=Brevibacillus sp. NRS-1366 TaxID=3233899 RepID=UPI003D1EB590
MLLEWWERYRRFILLGGAFLFLGSSLWFYRADQASEKSRLPLETPAYTQVQLPAPSEPDVQGLANKQTEAPSEKRKDIAPSDAPLFVDVKGRVMKPGLYRFDAGMRVADAITKAGGSLPDADLDQINLAEPLSDGSAVVIPAKGTDTHNVLGQQVQPLSSSAISSRTERQSSDPSINLNTATVEELTTLPGIGAARANSILSYRSEKGGFRSVEEIKEIEGIGDKMFERIKDRIRIR